MILMNIKGENNFAPDKNTAFNISLNDSNQIIQTIIEVLFE